MFCFCSFVIVQFYIPQNICMISTFCGFASLAWLMMGHFFFLSPQREKKGSKVFLHGTCSNVKEPCPEKWCALEQQDMKYESTLFKMPLTPFCESFQCTLQMFTGIYGVPIGFFCNIYGKEKPYTPQRERLCMITKGFRYNL